MNEFTRYHNTQHQKKLQNGYRLGFSISSGLLLFGLTMLAAGLYTQGLAVIVFSAIYTGVTAVVWARFTREVAPHTTLRHRMAVLLVGSPESRPEGARKD